MPQYFPDRFVRREINNLEVRCSFHEAGCRWEGKFQHYHQHLSKCEFRSSLCPLSALGCSETFMSKSELQEHFALHHGEHLNILTNRILTIQKQCNSLQRRDGNDRSKEVSSMLFPEIVESDGPKHDSGFDEELPYKYRLQVEEPDCASSLYPTTAQMDGLVRKTVQEMLGRQQDDIKLLLKEKDSEIASLKTTVTKLEKTIKSKHAELEDRDFRLSLIENSNHDGTMIWKIPQFSQRKADAVNGKYTSIFSLPFHSGRYGYKMCLRLYIMGDGIGKGTHLSLFFVVMRGEFDNILQWPFTHKVTFKLINQSGGRDIVDTFQPDPMSSSFRKPKSDMNIASGCPRFVSHTELERGGFVVDDTIFIKCMIDTTTIRHP